MAKKYLIDTSAVIEYLNGSLIDSGLQFIDGIINDDCCISFISEIELMVWNPINKEDLEIYSLFVQQVEVIGIDQAIIAETIRVRKTYQLKLPDALIAATAVALDMTLIADNDKDFGKVIELVDINPNDL